MAIPGNLKLKASYSSLRVQSGWQRVFCLALDLRIPFQFCKDSKEAQEGSLLLKCVTFQAREHLSFIMFNFPYAIPRVPCRATLRSVLPAPTTPHTLVSSENTEDSANQMFSIYPLSVGKTVLPPDIFSGPEWRAAGWSLSLAFSSSWRHQVLSARAL